MTVRTRTNVSRRAEIAMEAVALDAFKNCADPCSLGTGSGTSLAMPTVALWSASAERGRARVEKPVPEREGR